MTKKNLRPQQAAPVQREITAPVSHDGNAIAPYSRFISWGCLLRATMRSSLLSLFLLAGAHGLPQ